MLVSAIHQHQSAIGIHGPLPRDFSLYACRVFYLFIHCHIPVAPGPITSWQIDGETVETVADFVLGGSKITDGNCSHEIKRCLLLGKKVMTNLDSILKSRDITLSSEVHLVKAMVFPVVMNGCKSSTIKKAEC